GVRDAVPRRWNVGLHVRKPDLGPVSDGFSGLGDGLSARAVPPHRCGCAHRNVCPVSPGAAGDCKLMDVALSQNGKRAMRVFFGLLVLFLYAPIAILLIFSFNNSELPTFPLSGFTLHWYHQFITNPDLRAALETSALVAVLSSIGAVLLGVLASIALARRRFGGKAAVSALLLSPLVIPYVVFGISLLLFFHAAGIPRSILTVAIGHIVISLPSTILVVVPRLDTIDA